MTSEGTLDINLTKIVNLFFKEFNTAEYKMFPVIMMQFFCSDQMFVKQISSINETDLPEKYRKVLRQAKLVLLNPRSEVYASQMYAEVSILMEQLKKEFETGETQTFVSKCLQELYESLKGTGSYKPTVPSLNATDTTNTDSTNKPTKTEEVTRAKSTKRKRNRNDSADNKRNKR